MAQPRRSLLMILTLAVAACLAWLGQVVWIMGWDSLAWLTLIAGPETLPSCALVALAVMVPWYAALRFHPWRGLLLLVALTGLGWASLQLTGPFFAGVYNPFIGYSIQEFGIFGTVFLQLWVPVALGILFSLACWGLLRTLAGPVRRKGLWLFPLALLVVLPASQLLVLILPALNGNRDFIHAVKMGYPPGLTALLLGLASLHVHPHQAP